MLSCEKSCDPSNRLSSYPKFNTCRIFSSCPFSHWLAQRYCFGQKKSELCNSGHSSPVPASILIIKENSLSVYHIFNDFKYFLFCFSLKKFSWNAHSIQLTIAKFPLSDIWCIHNVTWPSPSSYRTFLSPPKETLLPLISYFHSSPPLAFATTNFLSLSIHLFWIFHIIWNHTGPSFTSRFLKCILTVVFISTSFLIRAE